MQSSVNLYGLKIENISPNNLSTNIKANETIEITFNSDLNTSSIVGNIVVVKDSNLQFTDIDSLNIVPFEIVEGNVSYSNKVLTFKPKELLSLNTRYVIAIKNNIKDILGKGMLQSFVSSFFTSATDIEQITVITSPLNNSKYNEMPEFTWTKSDKNMYTFQVSRFNTFESLIFEKEVTTNVFKPDVKLNNDVYYVRVKAIDTNFSGSLQIYINTIENYPVSTSDEVFDNDVLLNFENNDIEVLDIFPKTEDINIDTKLKNIYIKVSGIVEYKDLNIYENFIKGVIYDENDLDVNVDHGELDYNLSIINDTDENVSYIIISLI